MKVVLLLGGAVLLGLGLLRVIAALMRPRRDVTPRWVNEHVYKKDGDHG